MTVPINIVNKFCCYFQSWQCRKVNWCTPTSHHSLHSIRKSPKLRPFLSWEHTPIRGQQHPDEENQIRYQTHALGSRRERVNISMEWVPYWIRYQNQVRNFIIKFFISPIEFSDLLEIILLSCMQFLNVGHTWRWQKYLWLYPSPAQQLNSV